MKTLPSKVEYSKEDYIELRSEFDKLNEKIKSLEDANVKYKNFVEKLNKVVNIKGWGLTDFSKNFDVMVAYDYTADKVSLNIINKEL